MTSFDRLHPAIRHHVVNSLGWRSLRPFQEAVIDPILDGENLIVLAPTAGGKTEAAFLPILSRMLTEEWSAPSVLYLCPIKALLNNLGERLDTYCRWMGGRAAVWHGDVSASARKKLLADPPSVLLTTPESLEVMLISSRLDRPVWFGGLQAVIVDEIHAFAGDDRGWHLLSVLQRIERLAGRELQRIGLSATVGNPETLGAWLAGSSRRGVSVRLPPPTTAAREPELRIDHVGSIENAATVISRLHRGEKRLVFVDSRAGAERLGAELRAREVTTFVTHSSLSQEQRRQAEEAFASGSNCVIVATSVLELGVDVGDLDRVIQLDAPSSVASFLQRLGRTGRRPDTVRNCLFLTTDDESLLQATGLIRLWRTGYVEPIEPPAFPLHILAQQILAISVERGGVSRADAAAALAGVEAFDRMPPEIVSELIDRMLEVGMLWDDGGILGMGPEGETTYGRRYYRELFSVFTSPPEFLVLHGRRELGKVDLLTFVTKDDGPRILLLGGRSWRVTHVDWGRRTVYVDETGLRGSARWGGGGGRIGRALSMAAAEVLRSSEIDPAWSKRTVAAIDGLRQELSWLAPEGSTIQRIASDVWEWWTFGGSRANQVLGAMIDAEGEAGAARGDSATIRCASVGCFALRLHTTSDPASFPETFGRTIAELRRTDPEGWRLPIDEHAAAGLKFSDCLPPQRVQEVIGRRLIDVPALRSLLEEPIRIVDGTI